MTERYTSAVVPRRPLAAVLEVIQEGEYEYGQTWSFDPTQPIAPEQLHGLLRQPVEFGILAEQDEAGEVSARVAAGETHSVKIPAKPDRRTGLWLHTHPLASPNTFLSNGDVHTALNMGASNPNAKPPLLAAATERRIVLCHLPTINPYDDRPVELVDPRDLATHWIQEHKIDLFGWWPGLSGYRSLTSYGDPSQQESILRDFMSTVGMLADEATWEDQAGMARVMAALNDGMRHAASKYFGQSSGRSTN